jgi:DNA-binding NarL/FixJ family response regulator
LSNPTEHNLADAVKIVIAEDHGLILDSLCKLLQDRYEIAGTASSGEEAVSLADRLKPDVILMDITLAGMSGLESAREIKQLHPTSLIIFVTHHIHTGYAKEAFLAGASGYVLKQSPASELMAAIETVRQGGTFVSPQVAERLRASESPTALTTRQREVLQLIAQGKSRREMAEILHVSMKTIEFHKNHLKKMLNLRTNADLIRYAFTLGLISE